MPAGVGSVDRRGAVSGKVVAFEKPGPRAGDIADASGRLWISPPHGVMDFGSWRVTPEQAQAASHYGWRVQPGSEENDSVVIARQPPEMGQ